MNFISIRILPFVPIVLLGMSCFLRNQTQESSLKAKESRITIQIDSNKLQKLVRLYPKINFKFKEIASDPKGVLSKFSQHLLGKLIDTSFYSCLNPACVKLNNREQYFAIARFDLAPGVEALLTRYAMIGEGEGEILLFCFDLKKKQIIPKEYPLAAIWDQFPERSIWKSWITDISADGSKGIILANRNQGFFDYKRAEAVYAIQYWYKSEMKTVVLSPDVDSLLCLKLKKKLTN